MQVLSALGTIAPLHTMEASLTFIGHFAMFVLEISSRILDMSSKDFNVIFIFQVLICKYEKLYIYIFNTEYILLYYIRTLVAQP